MRFLIVNETGGEIVSELECSDIGTLAVNIPDGHNAHANSDASIGPGTAFWNGDSFVKLLAPVPTVQQVQSDVKALIKALRDKAEWSGCDSPLGRVDSDPDSQRKVSGCVQMAMIAQAAGQPFVVPWTMQDNSTKPHDALAMIAMGVAVGQHVAACHAVAISKRELVQAATTVDGVLAVDIQGGWPGA